MSDRENNVFKAKLAEQAERYEEMAEAMKKVAKLNLAMTEEERSLLSVAYKNIIWTRRSSWRVICHNENKEMKKGNQGKLKAIQSYKAQIEKEIREICSDVLNLLEEHLIPPVTSAETEVFFYKMKGDYLRYLAEITQGEDKNTTAEPSLLAYSIANHIATTKLPPTNHIRLGLVLNYSVFYYDTMKMPDVACQMVTTALEDANEELDKLSEESYELTASVLQLLRENLTLWMNYMHGEEDLEPQEQLQDVEDQQVS